MYHQRGTNENCRKRQREIEIKRLTDLIHKLETLHKQSLSVKSATKLLEARKDLQHILDNRTKRFLFFKERYIMNRAIRQGGAWLGPSGNIRLAIQ